MAEHTLEVRFEAKANASTGGITPEQFKAAMVDRMAKARVGFAFGHNAEVDARARDEASAVFDMVMALLAGLAEVNKGRS